MAVFGAYLVLKGEFVSVFKIKANMQAEYKGKTAYLDEEVQRIHGESSEFVLVKTSSENFQLSLTDLSLKKIVCFNSEEQVNPHFITPFLDFMLCSAENNLYLKEELEDTGQKLIIRVKYLFSLESKIREIKSYWLKSY